MKLFRYRFILTCLIFLSLGSSPAQDTTRSLAGEGFVFLPHGLHIPPFKANIEEPRIGVFKFLNEEKMKVDIGNTIDIFGWEFGDGKTRATIGIDFLAYAFTTGAQGLRLQIDAIDGFFGGNLSVSRAFENRVRFARLRLLHHSAHLVDGHYNLHTDRWIDDREPIPFTRDFGELFIGQEHRLGKNHARYYGGFSYATLVRPTLFERLAYAGGIEYANGEIAGTLFNQPVNFFAAYQLTLIGAPSYVGSHQLQWGVKFGNWREKGPTLYFSYYTGMHLFAEYFDQRISTVAAGFTVDFF